MGSRPGVGKTARRESINHVLSWEMGTKPALFVIYALLFSRAIVITFVGLGKDGQWRVSREVWSAIGVGVILAIVGIGLALAFGRLATRKRRAYSTYLGLAGATVCTVMIFFEGGTRLAILTLQERGLAMVGVAALAGLTTVISGSRRIRESLRRGRGHLRSSGRFDAEKGYWDLRNALRLEARGEYASKRRRRETLRRVLMSLAPATGFLLSRNLGQEGDRLAMATILFTLAIFTIPIQGIAVGVELREWEREFGKPILFPPNESEQGGG